MVTLETNRHIPYPLRVETPSGEVHKYVPGGVINVSQIDAEWLVNTGDWKRVNDAKTDSEKMVDTGIVDDVETAEEVIEVAVRGFPIESLPDLDNMTKDEMVEYAQTNGIAINPRDKKDDIRVQIELFLDDIEAED